MAERLFYCRVNRRRGAKLYIPARLGRLLRHGGRVWLDVGGMVYATGFYSMGG